MILRALLPAITLAARDASMAMDCLKALVVLTIFLLPFYLLMRSLAKLTRIRYGFEPEPEDDGPPLRICDRCGNTVLEQDFSHCPYCGSALEAPVPAAGGIDEPMADGGDAPVGDAVEDDSDAKAPEA